MRKAYRVIVYEITEEREQIEAAEYNVEANDPWCAVKEWADEIELEESS